MLPPAWSSVLGLNRPLADERPVVDVKRPRELVDAAFVRRGAVRRREPRAAPVAEVRLGRAQAVPVGRRLYAMRFDGGKVALDAEEPLDEALGPLVAPFAEVRVADDAVGVDEVQRRPGAVGERVPDRVPVVDGDRVVDRPFPYRAPYAVDFVLKGNSGVWTPTTRSPSSRYARDPRGRTAPDAAS
jgi:hypothetical protein